MERIVRRTFLCWLLLALLPGCVGMPARIESRASPCTARGIVIVVDGAGGYQTAPRAIAETADSLGLPLHVRSFDWTHGRGRTVADVVDTEYICCQGARLAEEIEATRQSAPGVPITIVGFSAGGAVALAAAERLPADSVERLVLLAPAVSSRYDLRRTLVTAHAGVDVFTSEADTISLGLGAALVGTADGARDAPAGRVGFCPPRLCPGEERLATRLRQHPWHPALASTGNDGGHTGSLSPTFLKLYVMPLLASP
jgi:pimeloyl-ACP methyl ester carboxylesterase